MSGSFVVIGDIMTDVITTVDHPLSIGSDTAAQVRTRQGGAGANVAAWLARHGQQVTFVGTVGADPFGAEAEAVLAAGGVVTRVRRVPGATTGTCVVLVDRDGERTMLPDAGANSLLEPGDVADLPLDGAAHLHVSGYTLLNPGSRAAGLAALDRARAAGAATSVDPASTAPLEAVGGPAFREMTAGVALVLVTVDEAELLCDSRDPGVIGARLTESYPEVVIKLGSRGARWCSRGDPAGVEVPAATPAGPAVDTTGAGDAFAAAYLAARAGGSEPAPALTAATIAAATVVTRAGARPA